MNTHFKVFASYNISQYVCHFIHALIFVTVSKCRKSPKLTNVVIVPLDSKGTSSIEWSERRKRVILRIISCCCTSAEIYQFMAFLGGSVKQEIHAGRHRLI